MRGPSGLSHVCHSMPPQLKIQAGEQTLGALHAGTWPLLPTPHTGACPCPFPPAPGLPVLAETPACISAFPRLLQSPKEQSLGRTRGTQGADDRSCPLLQKAKRTDCTSPDPLLRALGARAFLNETMMLWEHNHLGRRVFI